MPFRAKHKKGNRPEIMDSVTDQAPQTRTGKGRFAPGGPSGNKKALKHAYQAMLNGKRLDERTSLFKAMREKELELITALGGDPSPQQQAIIADTVKNMLYIASLDNYLMGLKSFWCARASCIPCWRSERSYPPICARISKPLGLGAYARRSPLPKCSTATMKHQKVQMLRGCSERRSAQIVRCPVVND